MVDFVVHLLVVVFWCGGTAVVGKVWFSVVLRQLVGVKFAFFFDFFKFKSFKFEREKFVDVIQAGS